MSRNRPYVVVGVVLALALSSLAVVYWLRHEGRDSQGWEYRGGDPTILVDQRTEHTTVPLTVIGGVLRYDADGQCLYLELDEAIAGSELRLAAPIVWPEGTRPVQVDGRRGVAVGAFLGRFGGRQIFEGDEVWGQGWFPAIGYDLYVIVGGPAVVPCIPGDGFVGHLTNVEQLPYEGPTDAYLAPLPSSSVG